LLDREDEMPERRVMPMLDLEKTLSEGVIELRVSGATHPLSLAKSMIGYMEEGKRPALSCIGKPALDVAIKSIAIANGELAPQGKLLCCFPCFDKKELDGAPTHNGSPTGEPVTAIKLTVFALPVIL
jgi:stage V sporulation protein SpoVS